MAGELIPLREIPKLPWLPVRRRNGRLSFATLWRWCLKGLKARDGHVIKLRAIRIGGTLCTSEIWLREFFEAITNHDPDLAADTVPALRTPTQRQRAAARAASELEKIGI